MIVINIFWINWNLSFLLRLVGFFVVKFRSLSLDIKKKKFQSLISSKLPNYLCEECFQSLTNAIVFEKKVKESYKEFKDSLELPEQNLKTEIKTEIENEICYEEEVFLDPEDWLQDEDEDDNDEPKTEPESSKIIKLKIENVFSNLEEVTKAAPVRKPRTRQRAKSRKCLICPELFTDLKEYQAHRLTHTQCPVCFKEYLTAQSCFAHHNTAHREIPEEKLTCPICGQKFKRKKNVLIHVRAVHNKEKNFKCDICDRGFYEKTHLNHHKTTHSDDKPFECDVNDCDKKFRTAVALKTHKKMHHPDGNGEVKRVVNKQYVCNVCGKILRGMSTLKVHQLIHTQNFQYECDVCHKKCKTHSILNIHKLIHTGEKPHKCNLCPKEFRLWNSLNLHKIVHRKELEGTAKVTDDFIYECEICNKKCRTPSALRSHKTIHTGEKPFQCDICSKTFRVSSGLSIHRLSHGVGQKYTCSVCGMTTYYKIRLEHHMKNLHPT